LERLIYFIMNKKLQKNNLVFRTIMIIAIVLVLNLIFSNFYWHLDLTQNKIYSLSPVTKNILKNLDDNITIKVYFSKDLPVYLSLVKTQVNDLLNDFSGYAQGNIKIEFKDPSANKDEVAMLGIPKLQFNTVSKDEYSITEGYLGLALFFEDQKEVLPVVQNLNNLEYELVRLIKQLAKGTKDKLAFVSGQGEISLNTSLQSLNKILEDQYMVSSLDLSEVQNIPVDINTLIIVGPEKDFTDQSLYLIDQFLMRGGSLLVLNEGVKLGENLVAQVAEQAKLFDFLNHYGIKINQDLVLDSSRAMAPFSSGFISFSVPYYMWPKITETGFNKDNVMVSKLDSLVLAWSSSLNLASSDEDTQIIPLVSSSPKSWIQKENYNLDPNIQYNPASLNLNSSILAGFVSGQIDSYFKDKERPVLENNDSFLDSTREARIIVVGDSNFIQDSFLRSYPENIIFTQNIIDGLTQDSDLINIRSRGATNRPLKELDDSQKVFWKYFNIFASSILVVIYGVLRFFLRKKNNFRDNLL
jgi:ABC-2 type transport system permease protein